MYNKLKKKFNNNDLSITKIANKWYVPTNYVLNRYLTRRLNLPENEKKPLKEYYKLIL